MIEYNVYWNAFLSLTQALQTDYTFFHPSPMLQITFSFFIFFIYRSVYIREGNGTPLQYSCLENPMDGGAWWAAVHGVAKSWT